MFAAWVKIQSGPNRKVGPARTTASSLHEPVFFVPHVRRQALAQEEAQRFETLDAERTNLLSTRPWLARSGRWLGTLTFVESPSVS
jgi:hypothetical protein